MNFYKESKSRIIYLFGCVWGGGGGGGGGGGLEPER